MTPCLTRCGVIDLERPQEATFSLVRVALWLADKPRFNGHLHRPVSVAEHSLAVARMVPRRLFVAAVLHDAHEYVLGDLLRPVERAVAFDAAAAGALERLRFGVDVAMARAAGLPDTEAQALATAMRDPIVRAADDAACAFELKFCAPALTDWPEAAPYARRAPPSFGLAREWHDAVMDAAADLHKGGAA